MPSCSNRLERVWDKTGIDEFCDDYMMAVRSQVPQIDDENRGEMFEESLYRRATCKRDWCGMDSPLAQLQGSYEVSADVRKIFSPNELTVTGELFRSDFVEALVKDALRSAGIEDVHSAEFDLLRVVRDNEDLPVELKNELKVCDTEVSRAEDCKMVGYATRRIGDRSNLYLQIFDPIDPDKVYERRIKLGKELQKARQKDPYNIRLKNLEREITGMKLPAKGDIKLIYRISTDPIDVAQKSTNQRWDSCERVGGEYDSGIFSDIKNWNAVVFVYVNTTRGKPQGRVMMRHCMTNEGSVGVGVEGGTYGSVPRDVIINHLKDIVVEQNPRWVEYDGCHTPYIYHGYSDTEGEPRTQIRYGSRYPDILVIEDDEWLREVGVDAEWDEWLADMDYQEWVMDYEADRFSYFMEERNLRDLASDFIDMYIEEGIRPGGISVWDVVPESYEPATLSDVQAYRQWWNYVDFMNELMEDNDIEYGVITDTSQYGARLPWNKLGNILFIGNVPSTMVSVDNFALDNWEGGGWEDREKFQDFIKCIREGGYGKRGGSREISLNLAIGENRDKEESVTYYPDSITGCMGESFGVEPVQGFLDKPIKQRQENWSDILDGMTNSVETLKKYDECLKDRPPYKCREIIDDAGLVPTFVDYAEYSGLMIGAGRAVEEELEETALFKTKKLTEFV